MPSHLHDLRQRFRVRGGLLLKAGRQEETMLPGRALPEHDHGNRYLLIFALSVLDELSTQGCFLSIKQEIQHSSLNMPSLTAVCNVMKIPILKEAR